MSLRKSFSDFHNLSKAEDKHDRSKEGSRGGTVIGHRPNGDPIYASSSTMVSAKGKREMTVMDHRKTAEVHGRQAEAYAEVYGDHGKAHEEYLKAHHHAQEAYKKAKAAHGTNPGESSDMANARGHAHKMLAHAARHFDRHIAGKEHGKYDEDTHDKISDHAHKLAEGLNRDGASAHDLSAMKRLRAFSKKHGDSASAHRDKESKESGQPWFLNRLGVEAPAKKSLLDDVDDMTKSLLEASGLSKAEDEEDDEYDEEGNPIEPKEDDEDDDAEKSLRASFRDFHDLEKAKYSKRTGTKGHYKYYYADAKKKAESSSKKAKEAKDVPGKSDVSAAHYEAMHDHREAAFAALGSIQDYLKAGKAARDHVAQAFEHGKNWAGPMTVGTGHQKATQSSYEHPDYGTYKHRADAANRASAAAKQASEDAASHLREKGTHAGAKKAAELHQKAGIARLFAAENAIDHVARMHHIDAARRHADAHAEHKQRAQEHDQFKKKAADFGRQKGAKAKAESDFAERKGQASDRKAREAKAQIADMVRAGLMTEQEANERRVELEDRYAKSEHDVDLEKAQYSKRTGYKGHYKYYYDEAQKQSKAGNHAAAAHAHAEAAHAHLKSGGSFGDKHDQHLDAQDEHLDKMSYDEHEEAYWKHANAYTTKTAAHAEEISHGEVGIHAMMAAEHASRMRRMNQKDGNDSAAEKWGKMSDNRYRQAGKHFDRSYKGGVTYKSAHDADMLKSFVGEGGRARPAIRKPVEETILVED